MRIEIIRHYGVPFVNNANAKLIATGASRTTSCWCCNGGHRPG